MKNSLGCDNGPKKKPEKMHVYYAVVMKEKMFDKCILCIHPFFCFKWKRELHSLNCMGYFLRDSSHIFVKGEIEKASRVVNCNSHFIKVKTFFTTNLMRQMAGGAQGTHRTQCLVSNFE